MPMTPLARAMLKTRSQSNSAGGARGACARQLRAIAHRKDSSGVGPGKTSALVQSLLDVAHRGAGAVDARAAVHQHRLWQPLVGAPNLVQLLPRQRRGLQVAGGDGCDLEARVTVILPQAGPEADRKSTRL